MQNAGNTCLYMACLSEVMTNIIISCQKIDKYNGKSWLSIGSWIIMLVNRGIVWKCGIKLGKQDYI